MRGPFRFRRSLVAVTGSLALLTAACGGDGAGTSPDAVEETETEETEETADE